MSDTSPSNSELAQSIVGAVAAVQDAHVALVEGTRAMAAQKTEFTSLQENVNIAKTYGQIGNAINVGVVNADTLIESGNYIVDVGTDEKAYTNNWPQAMIEFCPVRVVKDPGQGVIFQYVDYPFGSYARRSMGIDAETGKLLFKAWQPRHLYHGSINIFLSKNGDDKNTGFTADYPVLTVSRALEIANSAIGTSPDFLMRLRFGAGDWGDITFNNHGYHLNISPYDGIAPTGYGEDSPRFGHLMFCNCFAVLTGLICDGLRADYDAFLHVAGGWKAINAMSALTGSMIYCSNSNPETDIWEIRDSVNAPLSVNNSGTIILGAPTIRFMENYTHNNSFLRLYDAGRFSMSSSAVLDMNGYSYAGQKMRALRFSLRVRVR